MTRPSAPSRNRLTATVTVLFLLIISAILAPAASAKTTTVKFPNKGLVRVDKRLSYLTVDNIKVTFENENATVDLYQIISNEFVVYPCNIPIEADTAITSVTFNYVDGEIAIRGQKIILEPGVPKTYDVGRNLKRVTVSVRETVTLHSIVVETADDGNKGDPDPNPGTDPDPEPVKHKVTLKQPSTGGSVSVTDINGYAVDLANVDDGMKLLVKATPDTGYKLESITADGVDITDTGVVVVKSDLTVTATFAQKKHKVTVGNPEHGKLVVTYPGGVVGNGQNVDYGTVLTIAPQPEEGYDIQSVTVNNRSVTLTEGKYTHTVTDDVAIDAVFTKRSVYYSVRWMNINPDKGTIAVSHDNSPVNSGDTFAAGTSLVVTLTAAQGFKPSLTSSIDGSITESHTESGGSVGIYSVRMTGDLVLTADFTSAVTLHSVSARISCEDGNASDAGYVTWKLKGTSEFDSPVKVESGKVITVSVKAADGYCITEASGMTLSADSKVKNLTYDLTVSSDTEITATFKAVAKGVIVLSPTVTGLPAGVSNSLNVAMFRTDGTPISANTTIEAGTKIRIVATLSDDRYRFASMTVGGKSAQISGDGASATIDSYELTTPAREGSASVYHVGLTVAVERRTVIVTYSVSANDVTVSVGRYGNDNRIDGVASGDRVPTDTELLFKAVPDVGYEIEAMTVTAGSGSAVTATPDDIDADGVCLISLTTPATMSLNLSVNYSVNVKCRKKDDAPAYKQHTVTLAVADGQEGWGEVRFTDPAGAGLSVSTRSKVTFEAVPALQPADGRQGEYSFAGWTNNASVNLDDPSAEAQSYGGDNDVTFTAHFIRNCRILFTTSPDHGSMEITRQDGTVLTGGDFVSPGSTITVTVTATESEYRVSAITVNGVEICSFADNPERISRQLTVDTDMLIGCVIAKPSGIPQIDSDTARQPVGWFTLQGVALGSERPARPGIYIAVYSDGSAEKVAVAE